MTESLQSRIDDAGGALSLLRHSKAGAYQFPIPAEFTNWREEQRAWREGVALIDQSFHMTDLYVEGPDAIAFVSSLAVNSFAGFGDNKAKQFVACGPDGHLIGDMIIFGLGAEQVNIVGRPTVANWVEYQASLGRFDVRCLRDERTLENRRPRRNFRFEIQGPRSWELLEDLNGGPIDQPRFFQMGTIGIGGARFRSLRHGMGGAPGLEFWGPMDRYDEVKSLILHKGAGHGIRQVGARAYSSAAVDSGWLPSPLPAIYSGEQMRAYRDWLPATAFDANASLGGSFVSDRIEDYYLTPWNLDYARLIRFDHDFVGREALEKMADGHHRRKVSLVIDADDATAVYRSQMDPGRNAKAMEVPSAHYASYPYDAVIDRNGRPAGISTYLSFLQPDNCWVALAVVDEALCQPGQDLTIVWGEPASMQKLRTVEPHRQIELRAKVARWPFSRLAQNGYRLA